MHRITFLPVLLAFLVSCGDGGKGRGKGYASDKYELMDIDKSFSSLSREKGMKAAFIEYIDSNGVMLLPGQMPVEGAQAIDYLISRDDADYDLFWKPHDGAISVSGDLGYTYGLYSLQMKGADSVFNGNYVTMWKKQGDGKWKFVLYSGQEGRMAKGSY